MNKEQTKEAIKVMQAWVDGKEIQFRDQDISYHSDSWIRPRDINNIGWNWAMLKYRIKPEPREFKLIRDGHGPFIVLGVGDCVPTTSTTRTVIKVREVLE